MVLRLIREWNRPRPAHEFRKGLWAAAFLISACEYGRWRRFLAYPAFAKSDRTGVLPRVHARWRWWRNHAACARPTSCGNLSTPAIANPGCRFLFPNAVAER